MLSLRILQGPAALVAVAVLVTGCATSPDFGETLETRGAEATAIARDYARGQKLVATGEKDIRQGGKLISKGEDQIDRGEDRIREGEALMARSRDAYCSDVGYQAPECR